MDATNQSHARSLPWGLIAAAAWLVPGLGHWLIGQRTRAAILAVTILGMFTSGLLIGGIDVIDLTPESVRSGNRTRLLWFAVGQVHTGVPAIVVGALRYNIDKRANEAVFVTPASDLPYTPSVGRVNELGTLYCALAGGLNLLCVLDVIGRLSPRDEEEDKPDRRAKGAAA